MSSPDSRNTARILGYSLILGVFLLLFFLAAFFLREAAHTGRTIRVHFPEIATLSEGDPVVENGVAVGKVRRISLDGDRPVAELQLFRHRALPEDTRFVNLSHSLMGARKVWIVPGNSSRPLDESLVQPGSFVPGLPETLHKVSGLVERVTRLRAEVEALDSGKVSLFAPLAVRQRLDNALRILTALSASLDRSATSLQSGTAKLAETGKRATGALRGAESGLDTATARVGNMLAAFEDAEAGIGAALSHIERLASVANDSAGMGKLLTDSTAYELLIQSVETLNQMTRQLRREGLGDSAKIRPRTRKSEE
jgi:ABC-type transporter Mla subunit MlaD